MIKKIGRGVTRRRFLATGGLAYAGLLAVPAQSQEPERPNILWLSTEDISPYLGSYGFEQAHTPNLDRLAAEGVRFTKAYANAPVCAVARSALLTGMHSTTIGTHNMRARTELPPSIPAYAKLFRDAGYYTTNNVKTDYNSSYLDALDLLWDENSNRATWQNRPAGKPFFAVFNHEITHESQLSLQRIAYHVERGTIPARPRIDPADIELPDYHPDLPEIREDWARLHDLITAMDKTIGQRLAELEEAGLADDTIVFFYSDHGGMLSRGKRFIYNDGTQVPLIVRVPEKWQHLAAGEAGTVFEGIAQFVDIPVTALALAGIEPPAEMQGRVLFGPQAVEPSPYAHFYRDRMAERPDCSRAITDGRYYYIHNFTPHRPNARCTIYGYNVHANWRAWREWYDGNPEAARADPVRSQFFRPKPVIQLFDTDADPWQVNNLADDPNYQAIRDELAAAMSHFQMESRDVGMVPESLIYDFVGEGKPYPTIYDYGQSSSYDLVRVLQSAQSASMGDPARLNEYLKMLKDDDAIVRYYGAYGLFLLRDSRAPVRDALRRMARTDAHAGNRVIAGQALAFCGDPDTAFEVIKKEADNPGAYGYVFLAALNAFQYSHTDDRLTREDWQRYDEISKRRPHQDMNWGFNYAGRITNVALELWPERAIVD